MPDSICPHYGTCGGCQWQDIEYPWQLKQKEETVRNALSKFEVQSFMPIVPSDKEYYYRNKMEYVFNKDSDGKTVIGMREKNRHFRVVNITDCYLQSTKSNQILNAVRLRCDEIHAEIYDLKKHTPGLRYLVIREAVHTNSVLVNIVTTKNINTELIYSLSEVIYLAAGKQNCSVVWSINDSLSDVAYSMERVVLKGDGFVYERLQDYQFKYTAYSFWQSNRYIIPKICERILKVLDNDYDIILDLYCGLGTLGTVVSGKTAKVVGIENVAEAVTDGIMNAVENGITNYDFISGKTENALAVAIQTYALYKKMVKMAIIADPPRSGLDRGTAAMTISLRPKHIVFLSCNLKTLSQSIELLSRFYELTLVEPYDMFPQTPHVETLIVMKSKTA
ncbi:MAG: 23S rRNA (uracil(1939)-C(5))-methyltransferase RlmD [Elusimicrobiota bacterium]